jgi:chaperonin GroEL
MGGDAFLCFMKALEKVKLIGEEESGVNLIKRALEEPVRQIAHSL